MNSAFLCLFCWLVIANLKSSSSSGIIRNIAKPDCPSKCGNLTIPYPFGIGSNCSMDPFFNIECNNYDNSSFSQLSVNGTSYPLANILESEIHIENILPARRCYSSRACDITTHCSRSTQEFRVVGARSQYHPSRRLRGNNRITTVSLSNITLNFSMTPYFLSDSNKLTTIGCRHLTVLEGVSRGPQGGNFASGCVSYCLNEDQFRNGSCPGNGCCQIAVPKGTQVITASISDLLYQDFQGQSLENASVICGYSYIGQQESFTFQSVPDVSAKLGNATVILDWSIGSENCIEAKRNLTSFVCQDNSECVDADNRLGGYLCRCLEGYEGNPYLTPGCQDIDECSSHPCHSTGICINTPGSYSCSCLDNYKGNGKDGDGCLLIFPPKHNKLSIGLIAGSCLLALLSILFWLTRFLKKKKKEYRKQKFFKENGGLLLQQEVNQGILGKTRLFTVKELEKATDNFNESRILGRGGQGTVYKGMLSDGQIVAIKKSQLVNEHKSEQLIEHFINEVALLSQINHRNVVKLLGCCLEARIPLLVYEFMSNGTLFDMIHDKNMEFPNSLSMHLKIATNVASALAYLHSATSLPIFHRDIKSSNVLLDEKFVAKVSDFGISKSIAMDKTHITTKVMGTFGYIDPEYFQSHQFTDKSDVYSFGVVLVELLTGMKAIIGSLNTEDEKSLVWYFLSKMENEDSPDLILENMDEDREIILAAAKLAKRCLHSHGKDRPSMKEVAIELEGIRASQVTLTNVMGGYSTHDEQQSPLLLVERDDQHSSGTSDFGRTASSDIYPLMHDKSDF